MQTAISGLNMKFAVLKEGLWECTGLKGCQTTELLVPIGSQHQEYVVKEEFKMMQAGWLMPQSLRVCDNLADLGIDLTQQHRLFMNTTSSF